jgi:NADPH-dependent curcumin reductase CurA
LPSTAYACAEPATGQVLGCRSGRYRTLGWACARGKEHRGTTIANDSWVGFVRGYRSSWGVSVQSGRKNQWADERSMHGATPEYAGASAKSIAWERPVVAVTARETIFEYAHVLAGQTALILGGASNVGAYAAQFAKRGCDGFWCRCRVCPRTGCREVLDYRRTGFEEGLMCVGPIIDTVGGKVRERWFGVLSPTGILVSVGSLPSEEMTRRLYGPSMVFFLVEVTTDRLDTADYSITGNGRAGWHDAAGG